MSAGPADTVLETEAGAPQVAGSAVVVGSARLGEGSLLAQGAVIRSYGTGVNVGTGSAVLENSVVIGNATIPTTIGRRSVFGHRCLVVGATVGDLCEIGNASVLMPGARLGDRVFLGEGTLVPAGMSLPDDAVAVGRPARIVRTASTPTSQRLRGYAAATSRSRRTPRSPSKHTRRPAPWASSMHVPRHRPDRRRVGDPLPDRRRSPATSSSANARSSAPA